MTRPHHPTPEAIELTEGEKDKIMNDFLLPTVPLDFSAKTPTELLTYQMALAVAYEKCNGNDATRRALKELAEMIEQAGKDSVFEGQQLPWKD